MEPTLFQISKQAIFPQNLEDLPHCFHVTLTLIFSVDKDVIQIHNAKDIVFFC